MRKRIILSLVIFLCAAAVFAVDSDGKPFNLTVRTDLSACLFAGYGTPEVSFYWQPRVFGVGADARALIGFSDGDIYGLALIVMRTGWFYVGAGVSVPLSSGTSDSLYLDTVLPAVSLGLDIPIFDLGPGKMGINVGLDYIITWDTMGSEVEGWGTLISGLWSFTGGAFKLDLGLLYSIPL